MQSWYPDRRHGLQYQSVQQLQNGEGGHRLYNSHKLMLGVNHSPHSGVPKSAATERSGTNSNAQKGHLFDERVREGVPVEDTIPDVSLPSHALDDANLMMEGVIRYESKLLVDEDTGEMQKWEQGDIPDIMKEEVLGAEDEGVDEQAEADPIQHEGAVQKAPVKKPAKSGTLVLGGSTKKRLVHGLISPTLKAHGQGAS
ncbi:hypothetical protein F2Q68_00040366 [Brassica cretica]|uniref:Uncharacterized protein n=1 Tax=Brassica cretica TaxID=69181 RepID=A0A8S9MKA9_BRACR|nr:hypothetical protein F2Q68_00040366 [Brassica cretica]